MEDLNKMLELSEMYPIQLERMTEEFLSKLRVILWGQAATAVPNKEKRGDELSATAVVSSPQQTKKRVKRLSSLTEDTEAEPHNDHDSRKAPSPRKSKRSNAELLASAEAIESEKAKIEAIELAPVPAPRVQSCINAKNNTEPIGSNEERKSNSSSLMPPPPAPIPAVADETLNRRPQRAAKLKSEKNLKEPKLSTKLRRPTTNDEVKIKLEHEQRASQMHETKSVCPAALSKQNSAQADENEIVRDSSSSKSDDSVVVVPRKQPSIVSINSTIDSVSTASASSDSQQSTKEQKKSTESDNGLREVRIKIKREKISLPNQTEILPEASIDIVFKAPEGVPLPTPVVKSQSMAMEDTATNSSTMSSTISTTTAVPTKKGRRKKEITHRPIKVERFSDLDHKPSPISSRTRHGSMNKSERIDPLPPTTEAKRPASIYEDAVETPPSSNSKVEVNNATITVGTINETINLGPASDATINLGAAPSDATFCANPTQTTFQVAPGQTTFIMDANPNATLTMNKQSGSVALGDATFDVQQIQKTMNNEKDDDAIGQRSFETAKDSSVPRNDHSLLTEDDSCEQEKLIPTKTKVPSSSSNKAVESSKTLTSTKTGYKIPTRTNELFNPLVQSPVKLRVEAFENAAAAATEQSKRPLRSKKENLTSSSTTPVIGKLAGPALGRFLTPTQGSNIGTVNSAIAKKGTTSASKAMTMPKYASASSLHRSNSAASTKTLQRENSADDFRKGLHNLAEERKKQREQKHLLAAQQREIKERERAERMAKLAKEREEKRLLKKQQEQEQKKKELEEIQRKLRQQQEEETAKLKAVKEREMLLHMKQQQQLAKQKMMPPPPKVATKYTFEMLHEDDSTDDEDKVSYKRPPPPSWSRSHVRAPIMLKQEYTPAPYIDSFFSVQPMTPDLKIIFPDIDARHLKRNSSVLWSTPPRYSELPKY